MDGKINTPRVVCKVIVAVAIAAIAVVSGIGLAQRRANHAPCRANHAQVRVLHAQRRANHAPCRAIHAHMRVHHALCRLTHRGTSAALLP